MNKARVLRRGLFLWRPPEADQEKNRPEAEAVVPAPLPAIPCPRPKRGPLLATYQPTVTVAMVGFSVCSDELKPPTSSYAKPYDSALTAWSCQNFEYEFDGLA